MADIHPQFFHTYYIFLKLNMDHLYKVLCFTKTVINYNKAIILYHGYFNDFCLQDDFGLHHICI